MTARTSKIEAERPGCPHSTIRKLSTSTYGSEFSNRPKGGT